MKLFHLAQSDFAILGITLEQSIQKYPFNWKILMVSLTYGLTSLSQIMFVNRAIVSINSFAEHTDSIFMTAASISVAIYYAISVFLSSNLFNFIESCEHIIDEVSEHAEQKSTYDVANERIEKWGKIIHFVTVKVSPTCMIVPKALICFWVYFTMDWGSDAFELPIPELLPFDWKNPIGYLLAICVQYIHLSCFFTYVASLASFGIGAFLAFIAIAADIKGILNSINENSKCKRNKLKTIKLLDRFIQLFSLTKQAAEDFSQLIQPIYMVLFAWSVVSICISMLLFQMNMAHDEINSMELLTTAFLATYAFGSVFVICELSQRIVNKCDEFDEIFKQFKWYLFPVKIRRILPSVIMYVQKPISIECLGSITCDRETFKRVLHGGYSYFMVFRGINK